MKLAVIADIHSNHIALKAALDYLEPLMVEGILFLGDYVSDCPYPQKTMELLYKCREKYTCYFVRGNREDYMLEHRRNPDDGWCYSSGAGSLLYTYENLTSTDLDFFAFMSLTEKVQIGDYPALLICHGSPEKTREWLVSEDDLLDRVSKNLQEEYLLCGHAHRYDHRLVNGKQIVTCPSVGIPTGGNTDAQWLLLEFENGRWEDRLLSVTYDRERLLREFSESGFYDKAKIWAWSIRKLIVTGDDYPIRCIASAWDKARRDDPEISGILPDKYWEEAARELGILEP